MLYTQQVFGRECEINEKKSLDIFLSFFGPYRASTSIALLVFNILKLIP